MNNINIIRFRILGIHFGYIFSQAKSVSPFLADGTHSSFLNHNIKSVPLVLTGNKSWQMPRAKRLKFMFLTRLLSIKMTTSE